ncbi:MAG TPA: DUF1592 domain-containing protein [Polyangiaceae bacterium]|nr:DUF1592 domain-containing protein [Polyangiaceae bacterium]
MTPAERGPSDDPAAADANFEAAKALAFATEAGGGEPLLALKPTGRARGGHSGGAPLGQGGALFDQLATFAKLARGERASCVDEARCAPDAPGPRALRRLSRWEYDRTVADLFGVASARAASFVDDPLENGFDNNARATLVAGALASQLAAADDEIAEELGAPDGRGSHALDAYEIASELSYLLTGTLPDDELFAAADAGALATADQLEAQARRLLATPKARETIAHFVELWLQTQALPQTVKDAAAFPAFDEGVRAAMAQETRDFVARVVESGGSFADLFRADYTVASPALASYYGLPAPGPDGLVPTAGTPYGGLLTHGGVLAAHSKFLEPGLIERGKFVRSRLLCLDTPPPPPSLMVAPPPADPNLSTRERFARHSSEEPCRPCHRLIDPIGFGFERFDAAGRHHLDEGGRPLGAEGELVGVDEGGGPFVDVRGLEALLADNEQAVAWDVFTEWDAGFCVRITVTNKTDQELPVTFQHELKGTVNNAWNVTITQAGDVATFAGQGDRARVGPMASVGDMGFCADK